MTFLSTVALFAFVGTFEQAPATFADLARHFDAGRYQQVIDAADAVIAADEAARPAVRYLAGLSRQKLGQHAESHTSFSELIALPEDNAWRYVGQSALSLAQLTAPVGEAGLPFDPVEMAQRAVALDGGLAAAHYQLGQAYGFKGDYANAAAAFDKASQLPGALAYAHYYAGLSYYRIKRIDLMATHFEAFLKLAPESPDRGEVESIMRTIRGR
jgi:tetratricopeptide (TPR) repeat protein